MATLTEAQIRQSTALTTAFKQQQNADAAKIAALIALYYERRVNVEDPSSIERWLEIMIPRLIRTVDTEAERARLYFETIRVLEVGERLGAEAATGMVDDGVRKSLLTVGPYDMVNKMRVIETQRVTPAQKKALVAEAKATTTKKLAAAVVRHAQSGGRQTIHQAAERDEVALGWVRVTRAKPCAFCAMLASRGLQYRAFKEGSFLDSDSRFTGDGDAKVHDGCGCSLKPVYAENDPLVDRTKEFAELWERWGAGGGDAALRFRRGYDHWAKTGDYLEYDVVNEGLRG
jgi:hypothetical protein